jgi:large-conductance mechanosensitive channel
MSEIVTKNKSFIEEFMAFVKGFGVIGLAVGIVIGDAATAFVGSIVTNIISPLLARIANVDGIADLWVVEGVKFGAFVASAINFIVLLLVVYVSVKSIIGRFLSKDEREKMGL